MAKSVHDKDRQNNRQYVTKRQMIIEKSEYYQEYATIKDQCMSLKDKCLWQRVWPGIGHNNRLAYVTKRQIIMANIENDQEKATTKDQRMSPKDKW